LNAASASAGAAETFTLTDVNDGALVDGDAIYLAAAGGQYVSAVDGGGGALTVSAAIHLRHQRWRRRRPR
jgi:hypothetical protein